jgi:hypothetical protein
LFFRKESSLRAKLKYSNRNIDMLDTLFDPTPQQVRIIGENITKLRLQDAAITPHHSFQLASAMISHSDESLIAEGMKIMEALAFQQWQRLKDPAPGLGAAVVHDGVVVVGSQKAATSDAAAAPPAGGGGGVPGASTDETRALLADCYFYVAVGNVKLRELTKARLGVERMLEVVPGHPQGIALRTHIENRLWREGVIGLGALVIGGFAGILAAGILRRVK